MFDHIDRYWTKLEELAHHVPLGLVGRVADILLECQQRGGTVFAFGNGGSAATASHFICDLTKGTRNYGLPTFRAVALSDNVALMTAWANDTSYERIFAEQLASLVHPGDVALAISTSGNSPNVVLAAQAAHAGGAQVIALTGATGGQLHRHAHLTIRVPSDCTELVEDAHLAIAHSLCVALRNALRPDAPQERMAGSPTGPAGSRAGSTILAPDRSTAEVGAGQDDHRRPADRGASLEAATDRDCCLMSPSKNVRRTLSCGQQRFQHRIGTVAAATARSSSALHSGEVKHSHRLPKRRRG